jgi:hypothetical protein
MILLTLFLIFVFNAEPPAPPLASFVVLPPPPEPPSLPTIESCPPPPPPTAEKAVTVEPLETYVIELGFPSLPAPPVHAAALPAPPVPIVMVYVTPAEKR